MLSAVVVRRDTQMPGRGCLDCARALRLLNCHDPDDERAFGEAELGRVQAQEWG